MLTFLKHSKFTHGPVYVLIMETIKRFIEVIKDYLKDLDKQNKKLFM